MEIRINSIGKKSVSRFENSEAFYARKSFFALPYKNLSAVKFAPHPNPPPRRGEGRVGVMS
jgi:hypothetical protein